MSMGSNKIEAELQISRFESDSTDTVMRMCDMAPNVWLVVGQTITKSIKQMSLVSRSLQLPFIGLSLQPVLNSDWTYSNDLSLIENINWDDIIVAASEIFSPLKPRQINLFYNGHQDMPDLVVREFVQHFTLIGVNVVPIRVNSNHTLLLTKLKNQDRLTKYSILFLRDQEYLDNFLTEAYSLHLLARDKFWLVIDANYRPRDLSQFLPVFANVVLIRSSVNIESQCKEITRSFGSCNPESLTSSEIAIYDVIKRVQMSLSILINDMNVTSSSTTADCKLSTPFDIGPKVYQAIEQINYSRIISILGFYTDNSQSSMWHEVGSWSQEHGLTVLHNFNKIDPFFINTFSGWRNQTISICSPPYPLFLRYKVTPFNTTSLTDISGMLVPILTYLSQALEFVPHIYSPADNQFGAPRSNSPIYSGCVGDLQTGKADLGGSLFTFNHARASVAEFLFPCIEDGVGIMVRKTNDTSRFWNVFRPISGNCWLMICAGMIFAALVTLFFSRLSPFSAWNLNLPYALSDEIGFQGNLWNIVGSYLMQGQDFYPYALSSRTTLAIWWIFACIIFSSYTADLTSFLTVTVNDQEIQSLEDLAYSKSIYPAPKKGSFADLLFEGSTSGVYKLLNNRKRVDIIKSFSCPQEMIDRGITNLACIADYSIVLYLSKQYCKDFYIVKDMFGTAPLGFLVPKNAYYTDLLNFHMQKLSESGLMTKWYIDYFGTPTKSQVECFTNSKVGSSVPLTELEGTFTLSLGIYLLSIPLLAIEVIWKHVLHRDTRSLWFF